MSRRILVCRAAYSSARKGYAMTPLRQRMIEDMQLRGFSPRTQEAYAGPEEATARWKSLKA